MNNADQGMQFKREARELFQEAVEVEAADSDRSHQRVREAIAVARRAMNWLEDSDLERAAHGDLHEYGAWALEHFSEGCHLTLEGTTYYQDCPIPHAHKRMGMSVGFTAKRRCSVCGEDLSTCDHMPGEVCMVSGGEAVHGHCRVCLKADCVEHLPGRAYEVEVVSIITEMEVDEVSLVDKPAIPDARIIRASVDRSDLIAQLGTDFQIGDQVNCHLCSLPCPGFTVFSPSSVSE